MLKVFMQPQYDVPDRAEGGIRRVVEAMQLYLPDYGVEVVNDLRVADLTAGHGVMQPIRPDRPFVSHSHGLHWSDYTWQNWAHEVNRAVVEAMIRAQAVTVPSKWVQAAFARGMLKPTEVVYHGVEAADWEHEFEHEGYVFWNKARADAVSNPGDMQTLAGKLPHVRFVSTIGEPAHNVDLCGVLPLPQMKPYLQRAGVYLATARETFGIGTLEALASGVPVVGWDYGGQSEIIIQGETGYLAPYGDYDALAECVMRALNERARLSANAREDAAARWGWRPRIEQYANIYKRVATEWNAERPKVSVIVTCHNLARYLPDALNSVYTQSLRDWECLIVDDASTDNTAEVARQFENEWNGFSYLPTPRNLKLSGARNFGFAHARGKYIIHLDADDMLTETALQECADALDRDPGIHIAYGSLDVMSQDGSDRRRNEFPQHFHWYGQMAHINQLHYAAMLRREVLADAGGYRERLWRAEDAEFWCRVTSFGYRAAKVTEAPTLVYRMRGDSKSAHEYQNYADKDGDWCAWFPWRIADTGPKGAQFLRQYGNVVPNAQLVPFAAQGEPHGRMMWDVWHHQQPRVSVIIPVGPGHRALALDALDSLIAQDMNAWEAVVVNDTGEAWDTLPGAPFARIVTTRGKQGPAAARNAGLDAARGDMVLFLDADDWLVPGALRTLLDAYAQGNAGYVYSDYLQVDADWRETPKEVVEYAQNEWRGQHAITALMATADARQIRFDETLAGWEDWDFFIRCAIAGVCGTRVAEPLFAYRFHTGTRREGDLNERKDALLPALRERHADYFTERKPMAKCCGGNGDALIQIKRMLADGDSSGGALEQATAGTSEAETFETQFVRMEFVGERVGAVTYTVNGHAYRGGNNPFEKFIDAERADVEKLVGLGVWRELPKPPPEPESVFAPTPVIAARYVAPSPTPEPVSQVADASGEVVAVADAPKPKTRARKRK